jgi:predicted amidophosphoribosyltransferase
MTSVGSGSVNLLRATREVLRPILDFIYPPRCPACGAAIGAQAGLCLECWHKLEVPNAPPDYDECGSVIAATVYGELSRKLVLAFKHGAKIALAPLLAQLIASQLGTPQPSRLIIPVPLHPLRLWRRGYNQSALLAVELQRLGHGRLIVDGLRRARHTPSLDRRSRAQRTSYWKVPSSRTCGGWSSFAAPTSAGRRCPDQRSHDGRCVSALRVAGARHVTVACFARAGSNGGTNVVPRAMSAIGETNARDLVIPA